MKRIYYCSACCASQAEREVIFQLINDIYICSNCIDEMSRVLAEERLKKEGNLQPEDSSTNKQSD